MVLVGSTPKGAGCCEVLVAGMIALLWCCLVIVLIDAEDGALDMCFIKSIIGGRRKAEGGIWTVVLSLSTCGHNVVVLKGEHMCRLGVSLSIHNSGQ